MTKGRRAPPRHDPSSGEETVRTTSLAQPPELRVTIRHGNGAWVVDHGRPRIALGRAPDCEVRLEEEHVSRFHAAIESKEGLVQLRDGSTNGTWVVRASGRPTWLHDATLPLDGTGTLHLGSPEATAIEFAVEERRAGEHDWRPTTDPDTAGPAANEFRLHGEFWTVAHAGRVLRLKDAKGLRYIAYLLAHPGKEILAIELAQVAAGGGAPSVLPGGDAIATLDRRARDDYRRRVAELESEIAEAEAEDSVPRAERARAELEAIATQLAAAVGLGGRDRPTGSHAERARVTVTLRLRESLKKIREQHPLLGAHLDASLKTGRTCCYRALPGQELDWQL